MEFGSVPAQIGQGVIDAEVVGDYGTDSDDIICGLGGNDTVLGGPSNDTPPRQLNNDTIDGGNGVDYLNGGDSTDTDTCTRSETQRPQ